MKEFDAVDLELLTDSNLWMYGPCFDVWFYFQNQHSLKVLEETLLCDRLVFGRWNWGWRRSPFSKDDRCLRAIGSHWVFKSKKWNYPIGFSGGVNPKRNRAELYTYPPQIARLCESEFYWRYPAKNIEQAIAFHSELIDLVRRLHSTLNFSGVVMTVEGNPLFDFDPADLSGIAIFDWVAESGNFNVFEYLEPCYAVLPLKGVPHPNGSMKLLYRA